MIRRGDECYRLRHFIAVVSVHGLVFASNSK
jgi:hypothetical protein